MDKQTVINLYDKILYGHTKNEVTIHAATWANFENSMPSESSQTQKAMYSTSPFM